MHQNKFFRNFKARSPGIWKALPAFIIFTILLFCLSYGIVFANEPTSTPVGNETTITDSVNNPDQLSTSDTSVTSSTAPEVNNDNPAGDLTNKTLPPPPVLIDKSTESGPITASGGITCKLEAWDITPNEKWSSGEISGYYENEYIPYTLTLSNVPQNTTISITVFYDKLKSGIPGVDHLLTTGSYKPINSGQPPFNFGVSGASSWSATTNPDSPGSGGVTQGSVTWTINTGSNNKVIIMFGAHLAIGSHLWNGASLHVNLGDGCGSQDVPIKVNEILYHQLSIDKKVSPDPDHDDVAVVHEGDNVTFTITARDDGNLFNDQTSATIVDTLPSGLSYVSGSANIAPSSVVVNPDGSTTITWNITLLEKTNFVITFNATVTPSAPSLSSNTATLTVFGTDPVSDTANVKVLRPSLEIVKSVDKTVVHAGDEVTYSFRVKNTGDTTLYDILVTDSVLGTIGTIESLSPGEEVTLEKKVNIYSDTRNVARATGYDELQMEAEDESSEVFVDVINPSLEIVKSVDKTVVHAGDEVTYSFRVKNTGDTTLYDILVTDSVLGTIGTIESLSPGEEVTLEKKVNIYSDTRNVARATGYDELQMEAEDESSEVFVDVINPSLEIVKSVDKTVVHAGDEVTYSFRVKNTGDTTLYDILVTDSVLGTIGTIESLSPGEEVTLEKKVNIYSDTRNVARATGYDELQMEAEDESSEVFVDVINPSLEIVKSVDKTVVHAGDEVTYSFRVKNTGDTTLYDILVTDSVLGTIGTIESLSPGEEVTLEKKVNIYSDTRNVARATGYDELQMEAEDESSEVFVDVINPSLEIVKSVDKTVVHAGDEVTYSFRVKNTGDTTLYDILVTDSVLGTIGTIESLSPGEEVTLEKKVNIYSDTRNVARATGYDELQMEAEDEKQ